MSINSNIIIGTVQFGLDYGISNFSGKTNQNDIKKILNNLIDLKINKLDTASQYGNAEKILGKFDLSKFKIISKFISKDCKSLEIEFFNTLKNLNTNSIYAYLCHRPKNVFDNIDLWNFLKYLKKENKVKKIGFSLSNLDEAELLLGSNIIPDIVQIPFNIFDHRFEGLSIILKGHGVEIHARSSFLQGLFFLPENILQSKFPAVKELVLNLRNNNEPYFKSYLMKYSLNKKFIDNIVIGIQNYDQLIQNIEALNCIKKHDYSELPNNIPENIINPSLW